MTQVSRTLLFLFALFLLLPAGPTPAEERPHIDVGSLSERIHDLVNQERRKRALPPLGFDPELAAIAADHSRDMMEKNYFGHVNPAGETPTDRGHKAGYRCRKQFAGYTEEGLAENLVRNSLYHATRVITFENGPVQVKQRLWNTSEEIAASTVKSWLESPEHRDNLLNAAYSHEGIGIVIGTDGKIFITQLFC